MERLMFFIFMPIIFEFICFLISHFNLNWFDSLKQEIGLFSVLLFIDYIIEFIYLIIIKKNLGVWIFKKSFIDECGAYSMFVVLSIVYIIITIFFGELFSAFDDGVPIAHTVVLVICFIFFCIIEVSLIHENKDDNVFELLAYQEEQNTIYLHAMGDGRETSGEVNGRSHLGTGWIHGKIETNYNLYYAFIDNERVVIRSIPYNENNVNIYEIGDNGEPRIVFHRYYKSYSCEKGHDKYDEYYIYDIYIPLISNSIKIDME